MAKTFVCHGIEWFAGDQCLTCQGVIIERWRIIELLETMRDTAFYSATSTGKHSGWVLENAIALIKGVNQKRTENGTQLPKEGQK